MLQCTVESDQSNIGMLGRKHKRRSELERVALFTDQRDEHPGFAHVFDDIGRFGRRRFLCGTVTHKVGGQEQPLAAHVADQRVLPRQLFKTAAQIVAAVVHITEQIFTLYDLEHRLAHHRRHRVATEGVEIARIAGEVRRDLGGRDNDGKRMARAHRLAHGDDVRDNIGVLESPHVPAHAG